MVFNHIRYSCSEFHKPVITPKEEIFMSQKTGPKTTTDNWYESATLEHINKQSELEQWPAGQEITSKYKEISKLTNEQFLVLSSDAIKYSIDMGYMTLKEALATTYNKLMHNFRWLLSEIIRKYITDGRLTFKEALALTETEGKNLQSEIIHDDIENGKLSFKEALKLTTTQRNNLESKIIRNYIADGLLTFKQILDLTDTKRYNLESEIIRNHIAEKRLTFDNALALTDTKRNNLKSTIIRNLISEGRLNFIDALALTDNQRHNLESKIVRNYVEDKILTFDEALTLTEEQRESVEPEIIHHYIQNNILTFAKASTLRLTSSDLFTLASWTNLLKYIAAKKLTIEQALELTAKQQVRLKQDIVYTNVVNGKITIDDVLKASDEDYDDFESCMQNHSEQDRRKHLGSVMIYYVDVGNLTIEKAILLSYRQTRNLSSEIIREYVIAGKLSFTQVFELTYEQRENLEDKVVHELIDKQIFTIEQALALTEEQRSELKKDTTHKELIDGKLTATDFMASNNHLQDHKAASSSGQGDNKLSNCNMFSTTTKTSGDKQEILTLTNQH
jgi:hypothetical protein